MELDLLYSTDWVLRMFKQVFSLSSCGLSLEFTEFTFLVNTVYLLVKELSLNECLYIELC